MQLQNELRDLISACFSGIYIETHEPDEAIVEIEALCKDNTWKCTLWDLEEGLQPPIELPAPPPAPIPPGARRRPAEEDDEPAAPIVLRAKEPLAAIRALSKLTDGETPTLLVLRNYHRFLSSTEVLQAVERQIQAGKKNRAFVVILAPIVQLPMELEKLFAIVEHALPDRDQLKAIVEEIATEEGELPDGKDFDRLLDAAAGLTRYEAENAFSLSLIKHGTLIPDVLWDMKAAALKNAGLLQLYRRGEERFDTLGGLDNLKSFCTEILQGPHAAKAKGVLLLGVPGTGKSAFCKALGRQVGRPTLILDIGALMGSLIGQTEGNLRKALKQIDAMAPCVVMIDEVEKALSGTGSQGDSGVSTRLFGTLLSWLQDKTSDSYVVCTCNDISQLPPEFTRAERFDAVFFLDLPSEAQRRLIWPIHQGEFGMTDQNLPDDSNWTGAEIKSCCRLAMLRNVSLRDAAQSVVPLAITAAEPIRRLRHWASGRCLNTEQPGHFMWIK